MSSIFNEVRLAQDSLRVMARRNRRLCRRQQERLQRRVPAHRRRQQLVLRDGLLLDQRSPRRPVPEDRGAAAEPAGPDGARAQGLRGAARQGAGGQGRRPTTGPSPELRDAMESPLPLTGLPLALTAAVFKGPAPKGSVVISTLVAGSMLPFVENDGMFKNDLEVARHRHRRQGQDVSDGSRTVNLNMKPDTAKRVTATGFRVISIARARRPAATSCASAVREANTRKAGSVTFDLEVPDFSKEPLSMSDIALTSAMSGVAPTVRPKDPLEKLLPGPLLSSYREFSPIDEIALFTEVYDNVKQPHKVEITATVEGRRRADGVPDARGARQLRAGRIRRRLRIPGANSAQEFRARPLRAARRSDHAHRRSADDGAGDRVPCRGACRQGSSRHVAGNLPDASPCSPARRRSRPSSPTR